MMDRHFFDKQMLGLYKFFQRKTLPEDSVADEWYAILKSLPNSAFEKAVWKLKEKERLPYNIPKAIKVAWHEFTQENPRKIIRNENYSKCEDCNSSGGFYVMMYHEQLKRSYPHLVFCSNCNNWQKLGSDPGLPRVSAAKLRAKGFLFKPYNQVKPVFVGTPQNFKKMGVA